MDAKTYHITEVEQVHKFFRAFRHHPPAGYWFRGHADSAWKLVPKAGRPEFNLPGDRHLGRFNDWCKSAVAYTADLPSNEWERLAVAQHFGLATCLLDWSCNPLVAMYFACQAHPDRDGAVHCYDPANFVDTHHLKLAEAKYAGVGFIPRAISPRILNQRAVFTAHFPPDSELPVQVRPGFKDEANLSTLFLPSKLKPELLQMLDDYGVNRVTLFPDLEGLSSHKNWETSKMVGQRRGSAA